MHNIPVKKKCQAKYRQKINEKKLLILKETVNIKRNKWNSSSATKKQAGTHCSQPVFLNSIIFSAPHPSNRQPSPVHS